MSSENLCTVCSRISVVGRALVLWRPVWQPDARVRHVTVSAGLVDLDDTDGDDLPDLVSMSDDDDDDRVPDLISEEDFAKGNMARDFKPLAIDASFRLRPSTVRPRADLQRGEIWDKDTEFAFSQPAANLLLMSVSYDVSCIWKCMCKCHKPVESEVRSKL
ncbi:hypothetical protein B0H13DRAFT_1929238 [Mycena leptocephala]|nr:hypothetical protein B0H13DRAFT_1929238 [Mycena leptocephala]